jgi:hypothetical protein
MGGDGGWGRSGGGSGVVGGVGMLLVVLAFIIAPCYKLVFLISQFFLCNGPPAVRPFITILSPYLAHLKYHSIYRNIIISFREDLVLI